jgi:hypothetical protein
MRDLSGLESPSYNFLKRELSQWMILSIQKTIYRMAKYFLYNLEDVVNL